MYVISVYALCTETTDGQTRLTKVMKKCRQYLHHTQKSVFEGEIFVSKLEELKQSIGRLKNPEEDYVVIYKLENKNNLKRESLRIE